MLFKQSIPLVCMAVMVSAGFASAQEPPKAEAVLRFDQAKREATADAPLPQIAADTLPPLPFACKLNRRRVSEARAYDEVTLWNVCRVRVKQRRMRLSDTTRRERVRLVKFFIERDRRKAARPRLLGNVAGYSWTTGSGDGHTGPRISVYTLRSEFDSVRRIIGQEAMFRVPDELWRPLPADARYELNGYRVDPGVFRFIDGLILRTLDIREERPGEWVVTGQTYPDRMPLVFFGGQPATIEQWLEMGLSGAFNSSAEVQMYYYYMLPLEAVEVFGPDGMYGAICIEMAD